MVRPPASHWTPTGTLFNKLVPMASPAMEPQLTHILTQNGVHDEIIQWMTTHDVLTTNQFANYLESRNEVQTKILDQVTSQRASPGQLARVKMAWRQAEAVCARGLDRLSAGGDIAPTDDAGLGHLHDA